MSIYGASFRDENYTFGHNKRGLLSLANSGRHTNTSQFFITLGKAEWLDNKHVVFGEMIEGETVLQLVELAGSKSGTPTSQIIIKECGLVNDNDKHFFD